MFVPSTFNCSGHVFYVYPPIDGPPGADCPGAAAGINNCLSASVCGNTLVSGAFGFRFVGNNAQALVMNNNFGNATYRGIGIIGGDSPSVDYLSTAQIFSNTLGEGVSFHVQLQNTNSFGWFLGGNIYVNTNGNIIPPFFDPASAAVHFCN